MNTPLLTYYEQQCRISQHFILRLSQSVREEQLEKYAEAADEHYPHLNDVIVSVFELLHELLQTSLGRFGRSVGSTWG